MGLDANQCCRRLGAVSLWTLGLCITLGLDLGRRRTLGFCSLPLWSVVLYRKQLVLGAWTSRGQACLFASSCCLRWRWRIQRRCGMVSARSGRSLRALVPYEPTLCSECERH